MNRIAGRRVKTREDRDHSFEMLFVSRRFFSASQVQQLCKDDNLPRSPWFDSDSPGAP